MIALHTLSNAELAKLAESVMKLRPLSDPIAQLVLALVDRIEMRQNRPNRYLTDGAG